MEPEKFCLYCFTKDELTKGHWFPEVIGGHYYDWYICAKCNSIIGRSIEGKIKGDLFFAEGLARLGIQDRQSAFRDIRIRDKSTGERLQYSGDELVGSPKMRGQSLRIAPPEILKRLVTKDVDKRFPNWLEKYKAELDAGATEIRLPGEIHSFRVEEKKSEVEYLSKNSFPLDLLAKIVYEGAWHLQQFVGRCLLEFYRTTFIIAGSEETGPTSIAVSPEFRNRVMCLNPQAMDGRQSPFEISYRPQHRFELRVTDSGLGYALVVFFEVLPFIVVFGEVGGDCRVNENLLGKSIFMLIEPKELVSLEWPQSIQERTKLYDACATTMWNRFNAD